MNPETYQANNSYNSFDYVGSPSYARKQPQVEEEVIDETVEEWEEEREDGTKVVVRKRTKRTKTTTTRDLYETPQITWTSNSRYTNDYEALNNMKAMNITEDQVQKLINDLDTYSNKPFTTE